MKSFIIKRDSNFLDVDSTANSLLDNHDSILRIPNSLEGKGGFGVEGLVCQVLATYLRNSKGPKILHTYAKRPEGFEFDALCSSLYGIVSLRLIDEIRIDSNEVVDRSIALESAYQRIRKVIENDFNNTFSTSYLTIPAIKAYGENKEFNCPFYIDQELIGLDGFRSIVGKALNAVLANQQIDFLGDKIGHISEIVRELFENTHYHARRNENGDKLSTNFRGVIFNQFNISKKRLDKLSQSGEPGLTLFCGEWKTWMDRNNRDLPLLDITIVDAGPGYAGKWVGKSKEELSFSDEKLAIETCFRKNHSSLKRSAAGSGLTHVLTDLRELRGWFRLRTGSVSVSKSFFKGERSIEVTQSDITHQPATLDGTSFNFVVPLVDSSV